MFTINTKALFWYEKIGLFFSVVFFVLIFSIKNTHFTNIFINLFCFALSASLVSIFKDWHWQYLLNKNIDPNIVVFSCRDKYAKLIEEIESAKEVDIMGISIQYTIDYLVDCTDDVSKKIGTMRILLPGNDKICNDRDLTQGTEIGGLKTKLKHTKIALEKLKQNYPNTFKIGYFLLQPYAAYTRIDDVIWVSPYIAKTGRSCPLLRISKKKSRKIFDLYYDYFETMWPPDPEKISPQKQRNKKA